MKRVKIFKGVSIECANDGKVCLSDGKVIETDIVLCAIGRKPVLPKSMPELELNRKYVKVNENFQTSIPNIYAVGDINGLSMLAHSATAQAVDVVEFIAEGKQCSFAKKSVPSVV